MTDTSFPPMTVKDMQRRLQELCGIPTTLRKQGTTIVNCPYCSNCHFHASDTGYVEALCNEKDRNNTIEINGRTFIPNYGYVICECMSVKDDENKSFYEILGTVED